MTLLHPALALLLVALACQQLAPAPDAEPQVTTASAADPAASEGGLFAPVRSSPPGPWRTASAEDLERLVLWPAHLLIRYAGSKDSDNVAFKMADFHSVPPPPTRSREEALALARELAQRAREAPAHFAQLVRAHSEDIVRRDRGGSLGGIPATQLTPWPEVLDALTALGPGEVSDVVETWYGFHVFQRRAAPEPDTVTGRRIVIAHDQARYLSILRGGSQPARSREEAMALAQRLYQQARNSPEQFPQLVDGYSELPDRVAGGDFGTWSNRELTPFPSEVEVLDQLEVGAVAPPLDSLFGIEILQRVANPARATYAIDGLQLHFDPRAGEGNPQSRASVHAQAQALGAELQRDAAQLPALSKRHTPLRDQWLDGRGSAQLSVALRELELGEWLRSPVQVGRMWVVGRRVAPRTKATTASLIELPRKDRG